MVVGEAAESLWLADVPGAEPVELRRASTVRDVVQAAVAEGLNQLVRFGPGVCLGDEPEDVHKSRVATRRMRSQLKSFSVAIDDTWLQGVRSDLGWLADGLGAVRDADVMILRIRRCVAELPSADQETADMVVGRLETARGEAAEEVRSMLRDSRCRSLVERLQAAASDPPVLPIGAERAADLASPLVSASWGRLERSVSALPRDPSDEDLHEVRIRAKRCRYTCEILTPVMGSKCRRMAKALTELQGVLGDVHDSHGTQAWLRNSAESTREALVAGMLIAAEAGDHAALLGSWRRVWRKAEKVKPRTKSNK